MPPGSSRTPDKPRGESRKPRWGRYVLAPASLVAIRLGADSRRKIRPDALPAACGCGRPAVIESAGKQSRRRNGDDFRGDFFAFIRSHSAVYTTGRGQAMPDIFFKCGSCGNHLVADDAGAGVRIDCPDCNTPTTVPEISTIGKCPRCRYRLKFSSEMKGELVDCPLCHLELRLPGPRYPKICPECGAGWVPPLHRCQLCSYSLDNPRVPTLIPD